MASEFFAEGGKDVALRITPGTSGVLQVLMDGEKLFDKADEGGEHPNLTRVKEMRAAIKERLALATTAAGD